MLHRYLDLLNVGADVDAVGVSVVVISGVVYLLLFLISTCFARRLCTVVLLFVILFAER